MTTAKTSQSTSALPEYAAAYKSLIPQYQQAGSAAYDPATEQGVAGFSAPQMQAFQGVQNNQGVYQPYLGAAAGLTAQGAGSAAGGIGQYINPFTQNVVNAAMDDWQTQSARTQQQVNSNAASIGALTGDRSQVASQLAREAGDRALSSNIANLYQSGFNTALGAAQNDQNRALAAGQQFAGLGGMAQQYGYQDVNALLGVGNQQQAQTQAELDAGTANAQQRQQYPMYMLDWQRQGLTGLGGAAGSNSTGTQQTPGPSMFQQVAGLGLSAAGLYNNWGKKANGGRVDADGGGMSKLLTDIGMAADGLSNIRRKSGGRVGYMDGGDVEDDEYGGDDGLNDFYGSSSVVPTSYSMPTAMPAAPVLSGVAVQPQKPWSGNLGLSDEAGQALMAAGFGMMGSDSPNALTALGEGGLAGLKTYSGLRKENANNDINRQKAAMAAAAAAERNAVASRRVNAAEEANRIREQQVGQTASYRDIQAQNLQSLMEQRRARAEFLRGILGNVAPGVSEMPSLPVDPATGVQPQSNAVTLGVPLVQNASDTGLMPGVQRVDDRAPMAPTAPQPSAQDMVMTPRGPMTPDDAYQFGMKLSLAGPEYGALGRKLMDDATAKMGGSSAMGAPAKNTIEEKAINAAEQLSRLSSIEAEFDPKYLTAQSQLGTWWNGVKAKFNADSLNDDERDELIKATNFRAKSLNNVNNYIKEITGAAMAVSEADRILKTQPNPGLGILNGVWDGDDPVSFKAKLDGNIKQTKMALARAAYMQKKGIWKGAEAAASAIPLQRMEGIINDRANAIKQDILSRNPKLKGADLAPVVRRQLAEEFGLEI
jgi:hypothetical protein